MIDGPRRQKAIGALSASVLALAFTSVASAQQPTTPTPAPTPAATPAASLPTDLTFGLRENENDIEEGESISYTATVVNNGSSPAKDVVVSLNFEGDFVVERADHDDICGGDNNEANMSCTMDTLAPGETWQMEIEGHYTEGGKQEAHGRVSSATADPNLDNNEVNNEKRVDKD